jgi:hypothetical protein
MVACSREKNGLDRCVILEVRKRDNGPPLLPRDKEVIASTNPDCWYQPYRHIHLAEYLSTFLHVITGLCWSGWVTKLVNGSGQLVPYQAAVQGSMWERVWEILSKPYERMRTVYRKVYNCKSAPDLYFGVEARFVPGVLKGVGDTTNVQDSRRGSKLVDIPRVDVPVLHTFVHFPDALDFAKRTVWTI